MTTTPPDPTTEIRAELLAAVRARLDGQPQPPITLTPQAWRYVSAVLVEALAQDFTEPAPITAPNPRLTHGDYRRAAALACAAVTNDSAGMSEICAEAGELDRSSHLLRAAGLTIAKGLGADTPEGLDDLREIIAQLAALEEQEDRK